MSDMKRKSDGRKKTVRELFAAFLKIGAFTFGGGYAMIALLENECIEKKKWMTRDEFLDMVAVAESTPGPVAINSATYIGYTQAGLPGALAATWAVCIPSFVVIYLISLVFDRFLSVPYVAWAFRGIRVCVVYLIASAGVKMLRSMKKTVQNVTVLLCVIGAMLAFFLRSVSFSSVFYILICGAAGVAVYGLQRLGGRGKA